MTKTKSMVESCEGTDSVWRTLGGGLKGDFITLLGAFFFPVRVKNGTANNHRKNNSHNENYAELIHFYSSLSSSIPQIENTKNKIIPHTKALREAGVPITLVSDLLGVFFPPVMVNNNRSENHRRDKNHQKKDSELIHSYSPLSKIYPMNNNTKNKTTPITNAAAEILSGVAIFPITSAIKTAWLKLKTTLPKFSLLRFVNLIKGIIQQATGFVKRT